MAAARVTAEANLKKYHPPSISPEVHSATSVIFIVTSVPATLAPPVLLYSSTERVPVVPILTDIFIPIPSIVIAPGVNVVYVVAYVVGIVVLEISLSKNEVESITAHVEADVLLPSATAANLAILLCCFRY